MAGNPKSLYCSCILTSRSQRAAAVFALLRSEFHGLGALGAGFALGCVDDEPTNNDRDHAGQKHAAAASAICLQENTSCKDAAHTEHDEDRADDPYDSTCEHGSVVTFTIRPRSRSP